MKKVLKKLGFTKLPTFGVFYDPLAFFFHIAEYQLNDPQTRYWNSKPSFTQKSTGKKLGTNDFNDTCRMSSSDHKLHARKD